MSRMPWARRCSAHRSNGEPCGAWAIRGGFVCRVHGGSAPQVKAAARARLFDERNRRHAERWERLSQRTRDAYTRAFLGLEDFTDAA